MRWLDAQSHLSKHINDRSRAMTRLQGVSEICLDPVMMTMMLKTVLRATTALISTFWHMSPNMLMCQPVLHCISCVSCLPQSQQMQCCQLCLQVTLLTESSRRLTSFSQVDYTLLMGSVSQLCDNFLSRPLCQPILKPLEKYSTYQWIGHWICTTQSCLLDYML